MEEEPEFTRTQIRQTRERTYEFEGRIIAAADFETRQGQPLTMFLEIWETCGGAYVAVTRAVPLNGGDADIRATVVPPADDELARRFAVMEHFRWDNRARAMARKELKWKFVQEIA